MKQQKWLVKTMVLSFFLATGSLVHAQDVSTANAPFAPTTAFTSNTVKQDKAQTSNKKSHQSKHKGSKDTNTSSRHKTHKQRRHKKQQQPETQQKTESQTNTPTAQ